MKKIFYLVGILITISTSAFVMRINTAPKRYLITAYGAKGDSATLNTKAIQQAIEQCSSKGGGIVVVPKGIFLSGAIFLKKGVNLLVEKGGVLKGSVNQEDYPQIPTRWEGEERTFTSAFINAIDLDGVEISGEGTINGSGDVWTARGRQPLPQGAPRTARLGRPRLICIQNCQNATIANLNLHNQAVWCLHVLYSSKVLVKDLKITADHNIPSSDGIDIDSSTDVRVTGCDIDVNDDCISIKSGKDEDGLKVNRPCENILIDKCRFGYGHGGVAMGSETSGGIRNVEVRDCVAEASNWAPIRFKSQPSRGGVVENITYRNIKLNNTRKAFEFNMAWRMVPPVKPPSKILPIVRNVKLINVSGTVATIGDMHGLEGSPITNVVFQDCVLTAEKGFTLDKVEQVDLSGLKANVKEGEKVIYVK
ncbi:glycoside hydrolase family 28 protein [Mucilaginibacter galii]|uniref:Endopolygalacturonase n=1 Tax=Mucilaginibacter galii TaxID=2005073 RepID=A0A917N086_9SPHI|nr:glycoside hydrolase family 28 protein [Mucilaginibacter galii]GGI49174.1 endopolygalacturonase [Mucilaginibacter galii]